MSAGRTAAVFGMTATLSCGGVTGRSKSNMVFELPHGFSGWVKIEYSVQGCPDPQDRAGRTTIRVSKDGTACSKDGRNESWGNAEVKFVGEARPVAEAPGQGACCQPAVLPGGVSPSTAFVWWGMGWTCEDSKLQVQTFYVGTVDAYNTHLDDWQKLKCGAVPTR